MELDELARHFAEPPASERPWGFWFLNDAVPLPDLLGQLDAFAAAGFGTICPCARIGLGEEVGYLTPAWWELMRAVVARCAELGLRVVLYDEASYPSGAANGLVVAENPEFASRCLVRARVDVELGTRPVYARPNLGRSLWDRRVATVVTAASGRRLVVPDAAGLIRLDPAELGMGPVTVEAFFDCPSGGTIRGAHAWQDDESPLAPASADLMNPDAVAAFVRLTHERYAAELGGWFGNTIVGWFTDEPAPLGRNPREGAIAWTPGFEADLAEAAGASVEEALTHLGDCFEAGNPWRAAHERAVARRVADVYHGAQRAWCDRHGLALTGHPERADELAALEAFTWPGQDTVWRWILPGSSSLHGPESVGPRAASSVGLLRQLGGEAGVPTVNEVYGAYGWRLTMDEMKWIADWLAVRGTSAFLLHALFASVRGNRAFESEPDLGLHNAWWPHLPVFLRFLARQSLLGRALVERPAVAVVVAGDRAPSDEVACLWEHQVPFAYVPLGRLPDVESHFDAIACTASDAEAVRAASGREALVMEGRWWEGLGSVGPHVVAGRRADLRVRTGTLGGVPACLVTNEGEEPLTLLVSGEVWDPWTGAVVSGAGEHVLPRHGAAWIVGHKPSTRNAEALGTKRRSSRQESPKLSAVEPAGVGGWGDWSLLPAWETFAGTVTYRHTFTLDSPGDVDLDLGQVGDLAEVVLDGAPVAHLFWAPYRTTLRDVAAGPHTLDVRVTNSSANRWEGALRPSGLVGPVTLSLPAG